MKKGKFNLILAKYNEKRASWLAETVDGLAHNGDLLGFYGQLLRNLNPVNVAGYIDAYINRTDLGLVPDCTGFLMEENPDKLALDFLYFLRTEGLGELSYFKHCFEDCLLG
ncbi:unnamed protein product [Dibothriocephalus latus]|uniref:Uncharacterized protein n=1 Tax=Dibothriocephalus latus TaxID=60516 RepID=A0A3P7P9J6_DIBLA|nr:unnamed protein product [Dibothriocephalus latus]